MKRWIKLMVCMFTVLSICIMPIQALAAEDAGDTTDMNAEISPRVITTEHPDVTIPYAGRGFIHRVSNQPFILFKGVPFEISFEVEGDDSQYIEVTEHVKPGNEEIYVRNIIFRGYAKDFHYQTSYKYGVSSVFFSIVNMSNGDIKLINIQSTN